MKEYTCTAIMWKSESCDTYLDAVPKMLTSEEIEEFLKLKYGDEFCEYCSSLEWVYA